MCFRSLSVNSQGSMVLRLWTIERHLTAVATTGGTPATQWLLKSGNPPTQLSSATHCLLLLGKPLRTRQWLLLTMDFGLFGVIHRPKFCDCGCLITEDGRGENELRNSSIGILSNPKIMTTAVISQTENLRG